MLGFGGGEWSTIQDPLCACGGRAFPRARTPLKQAPLFWSPSTWFPPKGTRPVRRGEASTLCNGELKGISRGYSKESDLICFRVDNDHRDNLQCRLTEKGYDILLQGTQLIPFIHMMLGGKPEDYDIFQIGTSTLAHRHECMRQSLSPRLIIRIKQVGRIFFDLFPELKKHVLLGQAEKMTSIKLSDLKQRIRDWKLSHEEMSLFRKFHNRSFAFLRCAEELCDKEEETQGKSMTRGTNVKIGTGVFVQYEKEQLERIQIEEDYQSTSDEDDETRKYVKDYALQTQEKIQELEIAKETPVFDFIDFTIAAPVDETPKMDSILEGVDPPGSVEQAPPFSKPENQRIRGLDEAQVPGAQEPAQKDKLAAETNHLEDKSDMQPPRDAAPIIGTQSHQTSEAERSSTVITPAHDTPQTNTASEKASQPEETSLVSDEVQGQTMQTINLITSSL